jgi:hypothetical protein
VVPLVDLQRHVRDAVINGDSASIAPLLTGGIHPARRFDIHRRHYEESLTAAITGRFPATGWLIGPVRLGAAARDFVHKHPPAAPCIAEYGIAFPGFLGMCPDTSHLTYLPVFADLDWHLGRLAVSVDVAPIGASELRCLDPNHLADMVVTLQPGAHYLAAPWAIDTLFKMYLTDTSPESWTLRHEEARLEVRGARGTFRFSRLSASDYTFRASLAAGLTLGEAAVHSLEHDRAFDPGAALLALVDERLITAIGRPDAGDQS